MTKQAVRPVRAWADYDRWSVYLQEFDEFWDAVFTPKGDGDDWAYSREEFVGVADFARKSAGEDMTVQVGPLRSLRVLLSNGHELTLELPYGASVWGWEIWSDPQDDAEAVQRAMTAAAATFNPTRTPERGISQDPETVDTD